MADEPQITLLTGEVLPLSLAQQKIADIVSVEEREEEQDNLDRQVDVYRVTEFNKLVAKSREPSAEPLRKPLQPHQQAMVDAYEAGQTLDAVGHDFGVTRERVRQLLVKAGVTKRHNGRPPKKPRPPKWTKELYEARAKARFWSRIDIQVDPDACWEWTGPCHVGGYPWVSSYALHVPWRNSKTKRGNNGLRGQVLAYWLSTGLEPKGWVMNTCRNPKCLNPRHIEDMPPKDAINKYRPKAVRVPKTHCPSGHEYTPENTYMALKKGYRARVCRACVNARSRRRYWQGRK